MKKLLLKALEPQVLVKVIIIELAVWILLLIPTVLYWKNSVAYLVFISVWAVIRTCLADLRLWQEDRVHERELAYQTELLHRLEETVDDAEKILGRVREDTRGEGTKGSNE